mmetsp:Transcript_53388/g.114779  ORF Transcript_53388/g.114779 Transcript_53388/m.114779 type:complete len:550 (-) Transcript_53388:45-1694(-)
MASCATESAKTLAVAELAEDENRDCDECGGMELDDEKAPFMLVSYSSSSEEGSDEEDEEEEEQDEKEQREVQEAKETEEAGGDTIWQEAEKVPEQEGEEEEEDPVLRRRRNMAELLMKMKRMRDEVRRRRDEGGASEGQEQQRSDESLAAADEVAEAGAALASLARGIKEAPRAEEPVKAEEAEDDEAARCRGLDAAKSSRVQSALQSLDAAEDPNDALYRLYISATGKFDSGDYKGADAVWTEYLRLAPDDTDGWCGRSQARARLEDQEGSLADLAEALHVDPSRADIWFSRGSMRSDTGDEEGALSDFSEALRLDPSRAEVWCCRGTARLMQGDFRGAADDCSKALEADSAYAGAWGLRGVARQRLGDHAAAAEDLAHALQLDSGLEWARTALEESEGAAAPHPLPRDNESSGAKAASTASSHRERGNVLFKGGKFSDAAEAYREAQEAMEEGWVLALSNRAICHLKLGQHAEAVVAADLCLAQEGAPHKAHLTKFKALAAQEDWEGASAAMRDLRALPDLPPAVLLAADQEERARCPDFARLSGSA